MGNIQDLLMQYYGQFRYTFFFICSYSKTVANEWTNKKKYVENMAIITIQRGFEHAQDL